MGSGPVGRGRRYARRFAGAMNRHSKACHRMPRTATVTQSAFPEPMMATPVFCGQCRRPRMSSSVFPPTVSFPVFQVFCLSACRSVPGFFPSPSIFPLEKGPPRVGPRGPRRPMARHRHRKPTEPKPSRNMPEEGGRAGNAGRRIPADAGVPASPASSPRVFRRRAARPCAAERGCARAPRRGGGDRGGWTGWPSWRCSSLSGRAPCSSCCRRGRTWTGSGPTLRVRAARPPRRRARRRP